MNNHCRCVNDTFFTGNTGLFLEESSEVGGCWLYFVYSVFPRAIREY